MLMRQTRLQSDRCKVSHVPDFSSQRECDGAHFGLRRDLRPGLCGLGFTNLDRSAYNTRAFMAREQPIPFSHAHHVGGLGLDCRYCHTSVESSSFAGIPPTKTCMNCHSRFGTRVPMLEPVRASFRTGQSIRWTRVHDLPDFVYFNHSIHVNKGVGCESCHGRVDKMPLTWAVPSLQMDWCLDCHRDPAKVLRPQAFITTMGYQP